MVAETAHLTAQTLEELAEGSLSAEPAAKAEAHVASCRRCEAELDAYRVLFEQLGDLPRFAPSAAFADAVMARVQLAPQTSLLPAWVQRLIPRTRRAWIFLGSAIVAPAMPIVALVLLLFTQPLLSPVTLWQWSSLRMQSMSQAMMAWLLDQTAASGLYGFGESMISTAQGVPLAAVMAAITLLGFAMPLSAWGLLRLTRTPLRRVN